MLAPIPPGDACISSPISTGPEFRFAQQFEKEESCVPLLLLLSSWLDYHRSPLSTLGSIEERKKKKTGGRERGRARPICRESASRETSSPDLLSLLTLFFFVCVLLLLFTFDAVRETQLSIYLEWLSLLSAFLIDAELLCIECSKSIENQVSWVGNKKKKKKNWGGGN